MAQALSIRISDLREFFVETRKAIESSEQCAGCSFIDNIPESMAAKFFSAISNDGDQCGAKGDLVVYLESLLRQAAECRSYDQPGSMDIFSKMANDTSSKAVHNQSAQASLVSSAPALCAASSQTKITAEFFDEFEKFRRHNKENDANYARWSLEQMLKFSATEREREELKAFVQFMKLFFEIGNDQFDVLYTRYLGGAAMEELRAKWTEEKATKEPAASLPASVPSQRDFDSDTDIEKENLLLKQQLETLRNDYAAEVNKVTDLSHQLQTYKEAAVELFQVLADPEEEEMAQEEVMQLLGNVNDYMEMLNGRRSSA